MERCGVVVESSEARSEGNAGHVILDEAVDVDDGGAVAELDARHQHEHQRDHRVQNQHFALSRSFSRHHGHGDLRPI